MRKRRKVFSDVSAALVEYVVGRGVSQERLADALEVSPAFISRVRTRERSFTVAHLTAVATLLDLPLGALLLAAVPLPEPRPETRRLHDLVREAIAVADKAAAKLPRRAGAKAAR